MTELNADQARAVAGLLDALQECLRNGLTLTEPEPATPEATIRVRVDELTLELYRYGAVFLPPALVVRVPRNLRIGTFQ